MTITIERDAILTVLRLAPPSHPSEFLRQDDRSKSLPEAYCETSFRDESTFSRKPLKQDDDLAQVDRVPSDHDDNLVLSCDNSCSLPDLIDDDDSSLSQSDEDSLSVARRVTFIESLVSEVRTRPRTRSEEIPSLFYSSEETQRFREQYRAERDDLSQDSAITAESPREEQCNALDDFNQVSPQPEARYPSASQRRIISRVVVIHKNTFETFYDDATPAQSDESSCFFDNDGFWSGSITWY